VKNQKRDRSWISYFLVTMTYPLYPWRPIPVSVQRGLHLQSFESELGNSQIDTIIISAKSLFCHVISKNGLFCHIKFHPGTVLPGDPIGCSSTWKDTQNIRNQGINSARGYLRIILAIKNTKTKLKSHCLCILQNKRSWSPQGGWTTTLWDNDHLNQNQLNYDRNNYLWSI
jgi:hypothetical protein